MGHPPLSPPEVWPAQQVISMRMNGQRVGVDGGGGKKGGGGIEREKTEQRSRHVSYKKCQAVCFEFRRCLMYVYTAHMKAAQFVYLIYCNPSQVCVVSLLPRSTECHIRSERVETLKRGAGSIAALLLGCKEGDRGWGGWGGRGVKRDKFSSFSKIEKGK